jgi:phage shock protein PspC (stress-responsive transcriptional regulator)
MVDMTEFSDTPPADQPASSADDSAGQRVGSGDAAPGELPPQPPVTDTAPPPPPPPPSGAFAARYGLVRPRSGRYLAGVCGAMARATNTDPVLWRVLFPVLVVFGGFGILAYLVLWLGTPADGDTASPVEAVFGRGRSSTSATLTVIVGVITVLIFTGSIGGDGWNGGWFVLGLVAVGTIVFYSVPRRDRRSAQFTAPYPPAGPYPAAGPAADVPPGYQPAFAPHGPYGPPPPPPAAPPVAFRPPRPPKEHSRLSGLIFSVGLLVLGVMGLLDIGGIYDIPVGAYFAAALAVIGLGLLIGSVVGRARGMIFLGLVLSLLLSMAGFAKDFTWDGGPNGGGDITWTPQTFGELQDTYRHQAGSAQLDLRKLDFNGHDTTIHLKMQLGDLSVVVPPNVDVTANTDIRFGNATVFDRDANGIRIKNFEVTDLGEDNAVGGGQLHLDIQVSAGNAEVYR